MKDKKNNPLSFGQDQGPLNTKKNIPSLDRKSSLKEKIKSIIYAETSVNLKQYFEAESISQEVLKYLHDRGDFFFISCNQCFSKTSYYDYEEQIFFDIHSDRFLAWLSLITGLNMETYFFQYVLSAIQVEALAGKRCKLHDFSGFNDRDKPINEKAIKLRKNDNAK